MSEYFKGVTFANQNVSPVDDAVLRRRLLSDGILTGCDLTYAGYTLTMAAGYLIACGRQIRRPAAENWAISDATSGYARVLMTIDMTRTSTEEVFDQVNTAIEYATSEDGFPELIQDDINTTGSQYQVSLAVVSLGTGGITGIVSKLELTHQGNSDLAADGAGAHNATYRGKYLGDSVTAEQYAAIGNGTFDDLYIGDYWTIGGVTYRIAAFDYYLRTGDADMTTHHVTLVPDVPMYNHEMNDSSVTTGGYVGSKMYKTGLADAKTTINNAFGSAHILTHRQYLCNAVSNGKPSGGSWYDSTVELMTEQNVYGGKVFGAGNDGSTIPTLYTVDKSQYPLFAFRPDLISKRKWFWLRDVASAAYFALVNSNGYADSYYASASGGVRPAFSIKA